MDPEEKQALLKAVANVSKEYADTIADEQGKAIRSLGNRLSEFEAHQARGAALGVGGAWTGEAKALEDFGRWSLTGQEAGEFKASWGTDSASDGGITVPREVAREIADREVEVAPMRSVARVETVKTDRPEFLVNRRGTGSGWVGERGNRPETATPDLALVAPAMGEVYANPAVTARLEEDSFLNIGEYLSERIAEEFAAQEGAAYITGDGINKPRGVLTYDISTAADASRAFGTLRYIPSGDASGFKTASATVSPADCLIDVVQSLAARFRRGAAWMMNANTVAVVRKWKDADGAFVWRQSLEADKPSTLLGYPVVEDENMPDVAADALPITFGNWRRGYIVADRSIRMIRDPLTNKPYIHFYTTKRVGGGLLNSDAIRVLKIAAA